MGSEAAWDGPIVVPQRQAAANPYDSHSQWQHFTQQQAPPQFTRFAFHFNLGNGKSHGANSATILGPFFSFIWTVAVVWAVMYVAAVELLGRPVFHTRTHESLTEESRDKTHGSSCGSRKRRRRGFLFSGRGRKDDAATTTDVHRGVERDVRPGRRIVPGDMPPPFPNGWFPLCYTWELRRGDIKRVSCLGQELVLFRGQKDGQAHVLDAYCPHLGADLSMGGAVKGDCITCPFHGWAFAGSTGECVGIPYADSVPSSARTKAWKVCERAGLILVHHHASGVDTDAAYDIPHVPELDRFYMVGVSEHTVAAHIQDIPENGADIAHLNVLHRPLYVLSLQWLLCHKWAATWQPHGDDNGDDNATVTGGRGRRIPQKGGGVTNGGGSHQTDVTIDQEMHLLGKVHLKLMDIETKIAQVGPSLVVLRYSTAVGRVVVLETVLPLRPMLQKVTHAVFCERRMPRIIGRVLFHATYTQFERDVPIWSSKTYLSKPLLVKEDAAIARFRRWYSQFYSTDSVSFKEALERMRTAESPLSW